MYKGPKYYFGNHPLSLLHSLSFEEAESAVKREQMEAEKRLGILTYVTYGSDSDGNFFRAEELGCY